MDSIEDIQLEYALAEAALASARLKHDTIKGERNSIKEKVTNIRKEFADKIYELQKMIQTLNEERDANTADLEKKYNELYESVWDAQREQNKAQRELDALQLRLDQAKRVELKKNEFLMLEDRWDKMTMGAPWREWAKDHQISGAKKITYEGRLILGDTMGLGKTLTGLIAIDMIEAATKDASEDNPIQFGVE